MAKALKVAERNDVISAHTISSPSVSSPSNTNLDAKEIALKALEVAVEQRSLDPTALFIAPKSSLSDYFVIVSGTSQRHAQGIADKIRERLSAAGSNLLRSTGYENGEWIVLDYGDVVIHVFFEPARHYYQLDQLWAEAEALPLEGRLADEARKLRTGMLI